MSILNSVFFIVFGLCGGGLVAAGLFAFINILGLVPRLAARTHTASRIHCYEDVIVAGAVFGNLVNLHEISLSWIPFLDTWLFRGVLGGFSGIFVGCLVMSLAEILDALPTMSRRIHLAVGLQYIIASLAVGKMVGALAYYWYQIAW